MPDGTQMTWRREHINEVPLGWQPKRFGKMVRGLEERMGVGGGGGGSRGCCRGYGRGRCSTNCACKLKSRFANIRATIGIP